MYPTTPMNRTTSITWSIPGYRGCAVAVGILKTGYVRYMLSLSKRVVTSSAIAETAHVTIRSVIAVDR